MSYFLYKKAYRMWTEALNLSFRITLMDGLKQLVRNEILLIDERFIENPLIFRQAFCYEITLGLFEETGSKSYCEKMALVLCKLIEISNKKTFMRKNIKFSIEEESERLIIKFYL